MNFYLAVTDINRYNNLSKINPKDVNFRQRGSHKFQNVSSTITVGGEEYEVPTGTTEDSRVKIISFDSVRYTKNFFRKIYKEIDY